MPGAVRNINVLLTANTTDLQAGMVRSSAAVKGLQKNVDDSNRSMLTGANLMKAGLAAGAAVAAAGLAYAAAKAIEFDKAMRNVNSITGLAPEGFRALSAEVVQMSRELPQSAANLAEGLYEISSSGFQGAEGMKVLRSAAEAASAGLTTTDVAAGAITATLNAYGMGADKAADVSDILFQTVNLGALSFEELAGSMGQVVGLASTAGVGVDELGAAIATLTLSGNSGAESTTLLTNLFSKMLRPSEALKDKFKELGYESGESMLKQHGLKGSLDILAGSIDGSATSWMNLFPDIQAARGAMGLMANDGAKYTEVSDQLTDANKRAGATQRTLAEQMKAVANQAQLAKNQVEATAIAVGTKLLPMLLSGLEGAARFGSAMKDGLGRLGEELGPTWDALGDIFGDVWEILVDLGNAVGPLAQAFAMIGIGTVVVTLNALATALSAVTELAADNEEIFLALSAALAVHLMGGVSIAVLRLQVALVPALQAATGAAASLTGGLAAAKASLAGIAATLGPLVLVAAGVYALTKVYQGMAEGADQAKAAVKKFQDLGDDPKASLQSQIDGARGLISEYDRLKGISDDWEAMNPIERIASGDVLKVRGIQKELGDMGDAAKQAKEDLLVLEAGARGLGVGLDEMEKAGIRSGDSSQAMADKMRTYRDAQQEALNSIPPMKDGLESLGSPAEIVAQKTKEMDERIKELGETMAGFITPLDTYTGLLTAAQDKAKETAAKTAEATESQKDSWEDYVRKVDVSVAEYLAALERQVADQTNWQTNMLVLSSKVSQGTLDELARMGPEGAPLVAKLATASDAELAKMELLFGRRSKGAVDAASAELIAAQPILTKLGGSLGAGVVAELSAKLANGTTTVAEIANQYAAVLAGGVNPLLVQLGRAPISYNGVVAGKGGRRGGLTAADGMLVDFYADGGTRENHVAQIARPGDWRVWAEPETGGEAYIPLAPSKGARSRDIWRETGKRLGVEFAEFAAGGFSQVSDVPRPRSVAPYSGAVGRPGEASMEEAFEEAIAYVKKNSFSGDLVAIGRKLQSLGFRVSEHPAFGGVQGGHAPGSYHYAGRAIDVNYGPGGENAIEKAAIDALMPRLQGAFAEKLWRVAGHFNHLHLAMRNGGIIPTMHSGGYVNSSMPRSSGDRADERTIRAQVGELVLPANQQSRTTRGGDGSYAPTVVQVPMPTELTVVDADGALVGRMRVEARAEADRPLRALSHGRR